MSHITPIFETDPIPSTPLLTHEDRDLLHEVAETFYDKLTTLDKERGDKVWDLAERLERWLNQQGEADD